MGEGQSKFDSNPDFSQYSQGNNVSNTTSETSQHAPQPLQSSNSSSSSSGFVRGHSKKKSINEVTESLKQILGSQQDVQETKKKKRKKSKAVAVEHNPTPVPQLKRQVSHNTAVGYSIRRNKILGSGEEKQFPLLSVPPLQRSRNASPAPKYVPVLQKSQEQYSLPQHVSSTPIPQDHKGREEKLRNDNSRNSMNNMTGSGPIVQGGHLQVREKNIGKARSEPSDKAPQFTPLVQSTKTSGDGSRSRHTNVDILTSPRGAVVGGYATENPASSASNNSSTPPKERKLKNSRQSAPPLPILGGYATENPVAQLKAKSGGDKSPRSSPAVVGGYAVENPSSSKSPKSSPRGSHHNPVVVGGYATENPASTEKEKKEFPKLGANLNTRPVGNSTGDNEVTTTRVKSPRGSTKSSNDAENPLKSPRGGGSSSVVVGGYAMQNPAIVAAANQSSVIKDQKSKTAQAPSAFTKEKSPPAVIMTGGYAMQNPATLSTNTTIISNSSSSKSKIESPPAVTMVGGYAMQNPATQSKQHTPKPNNNNPPSAMMGGYAMQNPAALKTKNHQQTAAVIGGYAQQQPINDDDDDSDNDSDNDSSFSDSDAEYESEEEEEEEISTADIGNLFRYLGTLNHDELYAIGKGIDEKLEGKFVPVLVSMLNEHRDEKRALGEFDDDEEGEEYGEEEEDVSSTEFELSSQYDWNSRFQSYLTELRKDGNIQEKRVNAFVGLSNLATDFIDSAQMYGRIIISEAETPIHLKTIKPMTIGGIAGGDKYIVNNILFKFAVDNHGLFDSEEAAIKIAGHDLKGLIGYFNLGVEDLHFPLMALVDYLGFRLIAMSVLPINKNTIVYGSSNAGITMHNSNPLVSERMKLCASLLNLKSHPAGRTAGNELMIHSAADLEVHEADGKFYLLDFSRAFPPTIYSPTKRNGNLYQLFRVEFVTKYRKPLCADAYSGFTSLHDSQIYIDEIEEAFSDLVNVNIPMLAQQIDKPLEGPINLKEVLHANGINLRYLGLLRSHCSDQSIRRVILFEMIGRIVKHQIRFALRSKLKQTKAFLDHSSREAVIEILNLIFGNTKESNEYFDSVVKPHLLRNYENALSEAEQSKPFKSLLSYADLNKLFDVVQRVSSLRFSRNSSVDFSTSEFAFQIEKPFHLSDLEGIDLQIRHMNIVALALGYVLKNQARELKMEGSASALAGCRRLCRLALAKFQNALNDNPGDKRVLREFADTFCLLGDYTSAEQNYLKALKADDRDVNTMFKYAVFLEERERVKEAEEYYLRTLELNPNLDHCLQRYGHFLESQGNNDDAEEFFIRASKIRSMNAQNSNTSDAPRQMIYFL